MTLPSVTEILATTIENRSGEIADNVAKNNALLFKLRNKKKIFPFSGGTKIRQELAYAENSSYTRYSGWDPININQSNVITAADYDIKQIAIAVLISGLEELMNAGDEQFVNLLDSRMEVAEKTIENNMSTDVYSDGTADGGKQIGGLQLIVADAGTGTVGGLDSSAQTWWQNKFYRGGTDGGVAVSAANIRQYMLRLQLQCSVGNDQPDLWVMDNNYFEFFEMSLQALQTISDSEMAKAGFTALKWKGSDVVFDGGQSGACPSNHAYALNTDYLFLRPHKNRDIKKLGGERQAINQDGSVQLIGWAGNVCCSNRKRQGVLVA